MLGFTSTPSMAGQFSGAVAILGTAGCLWDDMRALGGWRGDYMAVNIAGCFAPVRLRHWATLHPNLFSAMIGLSDCNAAGHQRRAARHSHRAMPLVDQVWLGDTTGTSGLFAVRVALALGYDEVVLCGVPMDGSAHFYEPPGLLASGQDYAPLIEFWERYIGEFAGRVKSMSGNTRELLGGL